MTLADAVGESPVRLQRDVEQKNLEELNARLEKYILKQRAKDASREAFEKDLANIQQSANQAIHANTRKYEEQLRLMRQQRDEHASAREELQIRVSRQEAVITRLKDQLTEEKKYQNDLNQQLSMLKSKCEESNGQICKLQEQLRKTLHSLKVAESAGRSAEEQLAEAREAADKFSHEASALRAKCKSYEQDLSISSSANENETKKLKETIDKLQAQLAITEDNCRSEFSVQLSQIVEEYRKQCNEDKTRVTRELKAHYMPKLTELRQTLDDALRRENDVREANAVLTDQISQLKKEMQSVSEIKAVQEKRIQELTDELIRERNFTQSDVIATKDKEIERLRHDCQRLESDFDDLMDIKIQLALTIEKYRELLSEEEHRLGLETPGRKRKRSKRAPEPVALQLRVNDKLDNCLKVSNICGESINLDGFILKSGSLDFPFPKDFKLPAYGEVCVWIGERMPEDKEGNEATLHLNWDSVIPEDLTSEPMKLYDSKGNVVDQLEVETATGGDPRNDAGGAGCLIM